MYLVTLDGRYERTYLNIPTLHNFQVSHGILVLQLTPDYIREYLHLAMRVLSESFRGLNTVFVDNFE